MIAYRLQVQGYQHCLELKEAPFQHVFRTDTLHLHQVQDHVVTHNTESNLSASPKNHL